MYTCRVHSNLWTVFTVSERSFSYLIERESCHVTQVCLLHARWVRLPPVLQKPLLQWLGALACALGGLEAGEGQSWNTGMAGN